MTNRQLDSPGKQVEIPGLPIAFEDSSVIVVDKPSGMLSQPGKLLTDSVLSRVLQARDEIQGPALVHRLDMDTSGLLLLAKNRMAHRNLQQQFERRQVGKRYVARLSRQPVAMGGRIHLPLRLDIDDRPRQVVCHVHGKPSTTLWHRDPTVSDPHIVWLYPLTGRTHQLRVHMADPAGLGNVIQGDRLYQGQYESEGRCVVADTKPILTECKAGIQASGAALAQKGGEVRLMLHAQYLAFNHPQSGERTVIRSPASFLDSELQG